jgi:hypothetical protein
VPGRQHGRAASTGHEQRGDLVLRGHWPKPAAGRIADQREMNSERDSPMSAEQANGLRCPRTRHHQAARACDSPLNRIHDRGVDRRVRPEVVVVHDEHPGPGREPSSSLDRTGRVAGAGPEACASMPQCASSPKVPDSSPIMVKGLSRARTPHCHSARPVAARRVLSDAH